MPECAAACAWGVDRITCLHSQMAAAFPWLCPCSHVGCFAVVGVARPLLLGLLGCALDHPWGALPPWV